jgi:hypothetical protein
MMTPKEILIAARAKIEAPERWTQGAYAKTAKRNKADPNSPRATCWCILGAVAAVTGDNPNRPDRAISSGLAAAAGVDAYNECVIEWNDAPGRTHAEVLAAFDRAIAAADSA